MARTSGVLAGRSAFGAPPSAFGTFPRCAGEGKAKVWRRSGLPGVSAPPNTKMKQQKKISGFFSACSVSSVFQSFPLSLSLSLRGTPRHGNGGTAAARLRPTLRVSFVCFVYFVFQAFRFRCRVSEPCDMPMVGLAAARLRPTLRAPRYVRASRGEDACVRDQARRNWRVEPKPLRSATCSMSSRVWASSSCARATRKRLT